MNCIICEELLYEYVDGELDALQALIVTEHLRSCEQCSEKASQVRRMYYELDQLKAEDVPLPKNLDTVLHQVYSVTLQKKSSFTLQSLFTIQKKTWNTMLGFVQYVPYSRQIGKASVKIGKVAGKTLYKGAIKASGFLLRQGFKLALPR